jgi:hypothetical protein
MVMDIPAASREEGSLVCNECHDQSAMLHGWAVFDGISGQDVSLLCVCLASLLAKTSNNREHSFEESRRNRVLGTSPVSIARPMSGTSSIL